MSLWQLAQGHTGWDIHKWPQYFPAYGRHLARFVDRPVTVWEVGVLQGGSLQLWRNYLGPRAKIVGIDIDPSRTFLEGRQISIRIGDQSDIVFLDQLLSEFGAPDVVIDDGSHVMSHVRTTFTHLYPRMSATGVYFVEDLHTAYWNEFGGGLKEPLSFVEVSKSLIDELNAYWTRGLLPPTDFTRSTESIHFYDSMIVFERAPHAQTEPVTFPHHGAIGRWRRRAQRGYARWRYKS